MKLFFRWRLTLLLFILCRSAIAQTPAQVVQQYLDARAAGQYDKAYALLSPKTQAQVPMAKFIALDYVPPHISLFPLKTTLIDERLAPVYAFFLDGHDTRHYAFRVLGSDPDGPGDVLLTAQASSPPDGTSLQVSIMTSPGGDGLPRLDLLQSVDHALRREKERASQALSRTHLRIIALGILQYAMDHGEHYPDASHWTDEVMPYVKDKKFFHDPSAPDGPFEASYSYAFNHALSSKPLAKVVVPYSTILLFETTKNVRNASDTGQSVPRPGRHSGGTDYAFADGHVKWFKDGSYTSRNKELLSYTLSGK